MYPAGLHHNNTLPVDRELREFLNEKFGLNRLRALPFPDDTPCEPDDPLTPQEPFEQRPVLSISPEALRKTVAYMSSREPEVAGALLGPKDGEKVTDFLADDWGKPTRASFTFGSEELNRALRPYLARGQDVKGIIHSHPPGFREPSAGDLVYLRGLFNHPQNEDLKAFWFPIVEGNTLRVYQAVRLQLGGVIHIVPGRLESSATPAEVIPATSPLDTQRIDALLDTQRLAHCTVVIVGTGGGANLARNLVRCGVGHLILVDFDTVEAVNICRQEHPGDAVGRLKVETLAEELRRINPAVCLTVYAKNFCDFADEEIDRLFGGADLFLFAVDNLAANSRGNEVVLRLGKPALWSGLYAGGRGGEVVFWKPGLPCYRCLCSARYAAWERGENVSQPTESADIFGVQYLDAVTGMVTLGLLTEGAANGYGRLIEHLGQRNFLHLKITPEFQWNGRDIIREQLGIPADQPTLSGWLTAARADPTGGNPPCPDCVKFLQRS